MASGMEMMMKSFGIDPEKIKEDFKKSFEDVTGKVMAEVAELKATQLRIESKLDSVLEMRGNMDSMNSIESEQHYESAMLNQLAVERIINAGNNSGSFDRG